MIFDIAPRTNSTPYEYGDLVEMPAPPVAPVTLANMRLSLANGVAFIDASSPGALTPYVNGRVTVKNKTPRPEIPPAYSTTYVKSTTYYSSQYVPWFATNVTLPVTGSATNTSWISAFGTPIINQRFHIDYGSAKIFTILYYENYHHSGGQTNRGARHFTLWGSNDPAAFAQLAWAIDTGWTQIPVTETEFAIHPASDTADPRFIALSYSTPYRYYCLKFADNWGASDAIALRRIAFSNSYPAATGYIKAPGTGEALSSELITSWNNDSRDLFKFETFTTSGKEITSAINLTGRGQAYTNTIASVQRKLFKRSATLTLNSGDAPVWAPENNFQVTPTYDILALAAGNNTDYFTASNEAGNMVMWAYTLLTMPTDFSLSGFSLKQVIAPSATGVTIVSTRGGTVQNWESVSTDFNGNDPLGYTIEIDRTGHVMLCTAPGVSASSQPVFDPAAGATTSDGTAAWTEYTPAGVTYGPLTLQPAYGGYRRAKRFTQSIERAAGGDPYVHTGEIPSRNIRDIDLNYLPQDEYEALSDFIGILRGGRFTFDFIDEKDISHEALILNSDDIASAMTAHNLVGDVRLELLLLT